MSETQQHDQPSPDEEFDAAFSEEDIPSEPDTDEPPEEEGEQEPSEPDTDAEPDSSGESDDGGAPDGGDATDAEGASADTADKEDWKAKYQELEQRTRSWEGRISAAERRAREAEQRAEQAEAKLQELQTSQPEPSTDTGESEDDQELKALLDEYPDIAGPIVKRVRALEERNQSSQSLDAIKAEIRQEVNQSLAPIQEREERAAREAHEKALDEAHSDWRQIAESGALEQWVEQQPEYLREGMQRVMQAGTTQQVIDLLQRYKEAQQPPEPTKRQKETPTRPPRGAEAVRGRRGPPPKGQPDKDDFDAAWDEAP